MRRFERKYKEFKQKLFVELGVEGTVFLERSGDVGEDPPVKRSHFVRPDQAQAVLDREVAQLLRNRWKEIPLEGQPTLAPPPPPPRTKLDWPSSYAKFVTPNREPEGPRRRLAPSPDRRARVLAHWKRIEPLMREGIGELQRREGAPEVPEPGFQQGLIDAIERPDGLDTLPPRLACALQAHFDWEPDERLNLVQWWLEEKGLAYTIQALTALHESCFRCRDTPGGRWLRLGRTSFDVLLPVVRAAAVDAPDDDFAAAIEAGLVVARTSRYLALDLANFFAGVPAWFDVVLELANDGRPLGLARTPDQALRAVRAIIASRNHCTAETLVPVVDALGPQVLPALAELMPDHLQRFGGAPLMRDLAVCLAIIDTPEALAILAPAAGTRGLSDLVHPILANAPQGIAALANVAATTASAELREALQAVVALAPERAAIASILVEGRAVVLLTSALERALPVEPGVARRFVLGEGKAAKFWEITLGAASVTQRSGKLGSEGRVSEKAFKTEASARKAYDKLLDERRDEGWREDASTSTAA